MRHERHSAGQSCSRSWRRGARGRRGVLAGHGLALAGRVLVLAIVAGFVLLPAQVAHARSPARSQAVSDSGLPPANVSPPTIAGTLQQGETLVEAHGAWVPPPSSYAYQWLVCDSAGGGCAVIGGATRQAYTLTAQDVGHTILVQETATSLLGGAATASSLPTAVVAAPPASPPGSPPGSPPMSPAPPPGMTASSTALVSVPTTPATNEGVVLIATITSGSSASPPSGTVEFENGGAPIAGCASDPVTGSDPVVTITCQTSFAAATSPERLLAAFTPAVGSTLVGSTSSTDVVAVGPSPTSLALDVSNPSLGVGARATYTATIAPLYAGSMRPSGAIEFLDGRKAISACASRPLRQQGAFSTATCRLRYRRAGRHRIAARYLGDPNFEALGASGVQPVRVHRVAPSVQGTITATMRWSFYYTPTYTKVRALVVNGVSPRATVGLTCRGRGCPFARRTISPIGLKRCHSKRGRGCGGAAGRHARARAGVRTINLSRRFSRRRLRVGARITVAITRRGWVGKHYSFRMRSRRGPGIAIACLAPGGKRPGAGC